MDSFPAEELWAAGVDREAKVLEGQGFAVHDDAGEVRQPERIVDLVGVRIALDEQNRAVEVGGPRRDAGMRGQRQR